MGQTWTLTPPRCLRCGWSTTAGDDVCRYCGAHLAFAVPGLPAVALARTRRPRLPVRALRALVRRSG